MENPGTQAWAIKVEKLTKSFGTRPALRGIDLEIKHGESVVILGPNGAGKTTLIKILATIMNPSSGKIMIDGLDLKTNPEQIRSKIGIVTHQTFLYGNLTAYENLEFYGRMYDIPRRKERIGEVVAMVGMTSRLYDTVETLSRGMQQRLSIARSLLHKPSIMFLDEPETGLDQEAIPLLWETLPAEGGKKRTIVLVTHNLERGRDLGERLLILDRGKIVYQCSGKVMELADLREAYQHCTRIGS